MLLVSQKCYYSFPTGFVSNERIWATHNFSIIMFVIVFTAEFFKPAFGKSVIVFHFLPGKINTAIGGIFFCSHSKGGFLIYFLCEFNFLLLSITAVKKKS